MAKINYYYYTGKDVYNDGDAEEILLKYYKEGNRILESTDESFYLTTHIRENILNWYPFSPTDEVLEIGSGCGTLTDLLCNKCAVVYSVEGSKRRADITYERNKAHSNLYVYAGEFGKFNLNKKFDFVILIGVFEYAKRFFANSLDPITEFLKEIKEILKPTGKILMAIENRYGLKYWAGANEDHIPKPYIGFYKYDQFDIQTFGMDELRSMFKRMGWDKCKFYFPFPDYKLPEIVYTEQRLPNDEEIKLLPIYLYGSKANFDIRNTYRGLKDNNQFGFFSNSFLVECGSKECMLSNVIYAKEVSYRTEAYRLITTEREGQSIIKIAGSKKAIPHLHEIANNHSKINECGIRTVSTKMINDRELQFEYCSGIKLAEQFQKYNGKKDSRVLSEFEKLWNYYKSISDYTEISDPISSELRKIYSNRTFVLKLSLIDGNAANIIVDKDQNYVLIDQEWVSNKELPAEYLMFYSILHICHVCGLLEKEFLEHFNITEEKVKIFFDITSKFYEDNNIVDKSVSKKLADLNWQWEEISVMDELNICPVCYYDTGKGFNEEEKIYGKYNVREGEFYVANFCLPQGVKTIRLDPVLCGEKCMYFTQLLVNNEEVSYKEYNIVRWEGRKILNKKNPYIVLEQKGIIVKFSINLKQMTIEEIERYLAFLNQDIKSI